MKSILNSMKNWRVLSEILNAFSLFFLLLSSLVSRGQWIIPSLLHCGVIIHYGVAIISFSISIPENECFQCKAHLYQHPYFYSFLDCFSKDLLNLEIQYHILLLGTEEPHRKHFDRGCRWLSPEHLGWGTGPQRNLQLHTQPSPNCSLDSLNLMRFKQYTDLIFLYHWNMVHLIFFFFINIADKYDNDSKFVYT